ncbi:MULTISPECIES: EAL and HDOD domain-containing protein [Halomonadaceae]|uniref:EAL and HDOD domain-containing protein n=1 Tax=Halomonadaceae TaxID=28256 RepID=UPI0012F3F540|nr:MULTISPECIES: EAL domain-containing protein [Halomonas]CAD5259994.1 Signal transduction c-di-GMP phosphodiesterase, EAL/HD-GYP d [Halomonas sp. 156]CAD5288975.1 Signal transduction c-di-GMP phosphodiesterase, EAL/HD-GYP d [Halomonas sp. 113]CAD5290372.1 Signal transduction c-di-GMP phosphodiesterase, EAL/HD-GYP d [Halomonas sp. 59]CAD5294313.1 Signal transduction c-di-GMP phosphodiesterase, EAL/HD-GYP d [Halomonas sp. I3]VXB47749.1 Signal transduction c-di-GMP phosphodiesterase, EAL/HD-GYP 
MDEPMKNECHLPQKANTNEYTIAIQPIVDAQLRHVADELLYRANETNQTANVFDNVQATARACAIAVYEIGLDKLCGTRQLFINASADWLINPDLTGLPSQQIVIEVLEDTSPTKEVIDALHYIKSQGYKLALDDFILDEHNHAFLPFCDIVKFDISNGLPKNLIKKLHKEGITLLAERVETQEEFKQCKALGFTLFQGYFYERPKTQLTQTARLSTSRANQMQLLSALYSDNVRLSEISTLVARDPYLLSAIFKRANSAEKGSRRPTTKLIDCLHIIGLRELRTLVTIVMLANNSPVSKLNLIKGLTRAFACEMMADQRRLDEQESFIAGLFSLMPTILGISAELMKNEIRLGRFIEDAINQRIGSLGKLLNDVEAAESQFSPLDFPSDVMLQAASKARSLVYTDAS